VVSRATDWEYLQPLLIEAIGDTLYMVLVAIAVAAVFGTAMGIGLYVTRRGGLFASRPAYTVLNVLVNLVRPIPFIIFITAIWPVTVWVVGKSIGTEAVIFPMSIMASFAFSRLVEQNLVALDPGVIEAARSMGASRLRIIRTVILPETRGPLVLAFTFLFIGVTDMSAMAGMIGGGGLGDFAIRHGYQRFNWEVTFVAVAIIVVIVQLAQLLGNSLARRFLRR
jgi:D-methionine transport system permease protein